MNISDATSSLQSLFLDWQGVLVNPLFVRVDTSITWNNYQRERLPTDARLSDVIEIIDNYQYSFQVVNDGSIFRIYYLFDNTGREIQEANLEFCYLGERNKYLLAEDIMEEIYNESDGEPRDVDGIILEDEEEEFDIEPAPHDVIGWIRIDYGKNAKKRDDGGVTHAKCHMHLSLFPHLRMIVNRIPNPKQFVEFILAMCYPELYKEKRLDQRGLFRDETKMCSVNTPLVSEPEVGDLCNYMMHVGIPTKVVAPMPIALSAKKKKN